MLNLEFGVIYNDNRKPEISYSFTNKIYDISDSDEICIICRDNINIIPASITICNHLFHNECLLEWTNNNNNCPVCKKIFTNQIELEDINKLNEHEDYDKINKLNIVGHYVLFIFCDMCNELIFLKSYHLSNSNYDLCYDCFAKKFKLEENNNLDNLITYDDLDIYYRHDYLNYIDNIDEYKLVKLPNEAYFKLELSKSIDILSLNLFLIDNRELLCKSGINLISSILNNVILSSNKINLIDCKIYGFVKFLNIYNIKSIYLDVELYYDNINNLLELTNEMIEYKLELNIYKTKKFETNYILYINENPYELNSLTLINEDIDIININYNDSISFSNFNKLTSLTIIYFKFNKILDLPVSLTNLLLNNSVCKMINTDFSLYNNLTHIEFIKLYIPYIDNLPPNLTNLTVCNCNLREIRDKMPISLIELTITNNRLNKLPDLKYCTELIYINLNYNNLEEFYIPNNTKQCFLYSNKIIKILNESFPDSLTKFICCYNKLNTLPLITKNITILECTNNKLSNLNISDDNILVKLLCSNNIIKCINVSQLKYINEFECYSNRLIELPKITSLNILSVRFSHNKIKSIDNVFSYNSNISIFSCSYNCFTKLDLSNIKINNYLNCSHNKITNLIINTSHNYLHVIINISHTNLSGELMIPDTTNELNINRTNINILKFNCPMLMLDKFNGNKTLKNKYIIGKLELNDDAIIFNHNYQLLSSNLI